MAEFIITIIFVLSLGGFLFILARKAQVLATLPKNGGTGLRQHKLFAIAEQKIKEISLLIKKQIFLHKLLSWVKCLTLKIETKIDTLLHSIRKKAQQVDKELKDKR